MAARLQIDVINPAFAWAESFLFLPLERSARTMLVLVRIKGRNGKKGKKSFGEWDGHKWAYCFVCYFAFDYENPYCHSFTTYRNTFLMRIQVKCPVKHDKRAEGDRNPAQGGLAIVWDFPV